MKKESFQLLIDDKLRKMTNHQLFWHAFQLFDHDEGYEQEEALRQLNMRLKRMGFFDLRRED